MTKLVQFLDQKDKGIWANIRMDNNDPCWIGVAQTGVLVKKSKIGMFGAKLYNENLADSVSCENKLREAFPDDKTPPEMEHFLLKAFTNAVLHCSSIEEVKRVLNDEG